MQEKNYFREKPNPAEVEFSSSNFNVECHILSTGGGMMLLVG
jgi:hypothetical protein